MRTSIHVEVHLQLFVEMEIKIVRRPKASSKEDHPISAVVVSTDLEQVVKGSFFYKSVELLNQTSIFE